MVITDHDLQLKKLILDDDFTNIQNLVNDEINLMSILGVSKKELQHSNLLAWLFNPNEIHCLGDYFIKEFIKLYYKENEYQDLGYSTKLSVFDFVDLNFSDIHINREINNIDILITSKSNGLCILIENKIFAKEANGQLKKYRTQVEKDYPDFKHKIYIYLSLETQEINEEEQNHYVQFTYGHIIKLIKQLLSTQSIAFGHNTRFVLEQYLQTLKSNLNENEQIEMVAKDLYKKYKSVLDFVIEISKPTFKANEQIEMVPKDILKKYKSAFDLVFKYTKPSTVVCVPNNIEGLIRNEQTLKPFKIPSKSYVRFKPIFLFTNFEKLKSKGIISESSRPEDLYENWLFLFEFHITEKTINFFMKIGQYHDQKCRLRLYNLLLKHKDVFDKVEKIDGLQPMWHTVFQKNIITTKEYSKFIELKDLNLDSIIETRFRELIDKDLSKIQKVIEMEL